MSITSRELRHGNYLHSISGKNAAGQTDFPIHAMFVGELASEEFLNRPDISTRFEPIQLTEEWMKTNLATFRVNNGFGIQKTSGPLLVFLFHSFPICLDVFGNRTPLDHIKTVHQLQNLYYALTGEELKIKPL